MSLIDRVSDMSDAYAVMDGAVFEDLPAALKSHGLARRSLFLDHADKEVEKAGPWLVAIPTVDVAQKVLQLVGDKPAAVFWSCADGESVIFKHLRTLNQVYYPHRDLPDSWLTSDKLVLFRHYDPNVMALMLPILTKEQFCKVMGPAQLIVMYAPDYGGLRQAVPPPDAPAFKGGPLRIGAEQIERISSERRAASRRRIARVLRARAGDHLAELDDQALLESIARSEESGRALGLRGEQALGRWAYLCLRSNDAIEQDRNVREWFDDTRFSADRKMALLIRRQALSDRAGGQRALVF